MRMKTLTPEETWGKAETKLRLWAFHVYYRKTFKNEHEPILRFLKALKASCRPIRNRSLVLWWYGRNKHVTDADLETLSIRGC